MTDQALTPGVAAEPEWLRRRERGSVIVIRLMVWLALALGRPATRLLLLPICLYFLVFSLASRTASRRYLTQALGRDARLSDVFRHYYAFGSCVLDRIYFLKNRDDLFKLDIRGEEIVNEIPVDGGGCILLGAHIGSFEALRAAGRHRQGLRVNMVMFEENSRKVSSVLNAINPELAKDVISLGRPDSFMNIQRALENGNFVGVLADRGLTDDRLVSIPFLGAPARFPVDPFRMIAILQRPVVLMVALYRGGNRYEVHFERFETGALPRRPGAAALEALTARYVARLEAHCRSAPYNWFNFYDPWA